MTIINPKTIYAIAKKELMDNIRNKWIIFISLIYIIFLILSSYFTGGQSGENEIFGSIEATIGFAYFFTVIIIPIIAIILGYSTIVGEAENGALSVVLAFPVSRVEVLLGKFIGLGSILIVTTFIGFGISGTIIMGLVGVDQAALLIIFIFLAVLLGLVYLSSAILISVFSKTRSRAIGVGLILYFWYFIYTIIFNIGQTKLYNDWIWATTIFSPSDTFSIAVGKVFDINLIQPPNWLSMEILFIFLFVWIVVPLLLAIIFFKKRDI